MRQQALRWDRPGGRLIVPPCADDALRQFWTFDALDHDGAPAFFPDVDSHGATPAVVILYLRYFLARGIALENGRRVADAPDDAGEEEIQEHHVLGIVIIMRTHAPVRPDLLIFRFPVKLCHAVSPC